jgi:hypothetical protein
MMSKASDRHDFESSLQAKIHSTEKQALAMQDISVLKRLHAMQVHGPLLRLAH